MVRLIKVTKVQPRDDFKLGLAFNDGTSGLADLAGDLTGPLAALRDRALWGRAHLRRGVVTWNDDLDLAPEFLHSRVHHGGGDDA